MRARGADRQEWRGLRHVQATIHDAERRNGNKSFGRMIQIKNS